jgi:hypothetical protein
MSRVGETDSQLRGISLLQRELSRKFKLDTVAGHQSSDRIHPVTHTLATSIGLNGFKHYYILMTRALAPAIIVTLGLFLGLSAAPASADEGNKDRSERGSLTESVRKAERQGGAVLSAEPVQQDGRQVNRVKVLTNDGRVKVMEMDAEPRRGNAKASAPVRQANNNKVEGDPEPL